MTLIALGFQGSSHGMELFVDTLTKQVYTEPGPRRERIGTFEKVEERPEREEKPRSAVNGTSSATVQPQQRRIFRGRANTAIYGTSTTYGGVDHDHDVAEKSPVNGTSDKAGGALAKPHRKPWYELITLRGYTQTRYNGMLSNDLRFVHDGDKSIGKGQSFMIRRARLIFYGDLSDHLFFYFQQDLAAWPPNNDGNINFGQMRDAYADIFLEHKKEFRVRVGQSKVPFSFEALQSSANRLPLDRNDAVNSATKDERDLGVFLYWAPRSIRDLFKHLVNSGLKGSGDYGVAAFGVYNGQGANRAEANDALHVVGRLTYPYKFANGQILEAGFAGYTGIFVPRTSTVKIKGHDVKVNRGPDDGLQDERAVAHLVLYPQPFGLQAEYNIGKGPELLPGTNLIRSESLRGGYIQATYRFQNRNGIFFPFIRYQSFDGAKKSEVNAPPSRVRETDVGVEWQPCADWELTATYTNSSRSDVFSAPYAQYRGELARVQLQWNY